MRRIALFRKMNISLQTVLSATFLVLFSGLFALLTACREPQSTQPATRPILLSDTTWQLISFTSSSPEITADIGSRMRFNLNGTVQFTSSRGDTSSGTWRLVSGGNELELTTGNSVTLSEILELTSTRLSLRRRIPPNATLVTNYAAVER
ncbi:MAG: hypothetical protein ACK42Y_04965 [Candidatus Thermochlorobacter sp.]